MKLVGAIKVLSFWETLFKDYHDHQLRDALKLGIEALKWVKRYRGNVDFHESDLLPGETKD